MNCRKCGTEIKEGYTFCRKCSTPIEDIGDVVIPDIKPTINNTNKVKNIGLNFFNKKENNNGNEFIENKDRILKDQNNMSKAIVDTKISLIAIILGIIIFFIIVIKVASNL